MIIGPFKPKNNFNGEEKLLFYTYKNGEIKVKVYGITKKSLEDIT